MARKLRIEFAGAIYYVVSNGDRREEIFRSDADRELILATLGEVCARTGWRVHAFCLTRNQFDVLVETPLGNLVAGMKSMLGLYAARYNRQHQQTGHVFSGRYKSILVSRAGEYLAAVADHIHLSPCQSPPKGENLASYRWSSLPLYLLAPGDRPGWLEIDPLFNQCGQLQDTPAGRRAFLERLERHRATHAGRETAPFNQGWCFGDETFRAELLRRKDPRTGAPKSGEQTQDAAAERAEELVREELRKFGWEGLNLATLKKGDAGKVQIAKQLRAGTTMTLSWIARRLAMGTGTYLAHLLYWDRRGGLKPKRRACGKPQKQRTPRAAIKVDTQILQTDPSFELMFDPTFD